MVYKYKEDASSSVGLTLTWDVFKFNTGVNGMYKQESLTLTWDVFKWRMCFYGTSGFEFNFNMRCI